MLLDYPRIALYILAIDPSADVTGVAFVGFDAKGAPTLLASAHFDASCAQREHHNARKRSGDPWPYPVAGQEALWERVRWTRAALARFTRELPGPVDILAFEQPFHRGGPTTLAMLGCVGAYLTLSDFGKVPICPVMVASAKAVWGGNIKDTSLTRAEAATLTAKEKRKLQGERRTGLKRRCCIWASQTFGREFTGPGGEAEADAAAVAVAAYKKHLKAEEEIARAAAQKPMFGPGSGKKRPAAKVGGQA